ncbi:hypothetical protein LRD18_05665 [Halorhodospira halochloris]|uniref:hypothetical protein n=1 Tax=Halorhodospira halochloris TaxID=1052 RepID=UPI001EE842BC|nr:hypothetical protein [Halorhodospira halochloris]MCG5530360.1 hypothetical protein [Halorhodospira halochloris]MCG5547952.1 hypothetical protein [Halorhodospira halochloris]
MLTRLTSARYIGVAACAPLLLTVGVFCYPTAASTATKGQNNPLNLPYVSFYAAQHVDNRLVHIFTRGRTEFQNSYLTSVNYGHPLGLNLWGFDFFTEAQAVKHSGKQSHYELNAVLIARWSRTPWDAFIDTSFAFGEGLSWASEPPPLEPRGTRDDSEESVQLLNYLLFELEAGPPQSNWRAFTRIHHRSGVFGLFGGIRGGSNFLGLGLRYYFDEQ